MRNILITGAAQGIGRAIAEQLQSDNHLYVIDKQETDFIKKSKKSDNFLISDKASFISGETIIVDGGLTIVDYTLKKESEHN